MSCNPFSPICLRKSGEGMLLFIEKNETFLDRFLFTKYESQKGDGR